MKKRIGILTSGGDCPGLNATIRGVAKACYEMMGEDNVEIVGIAEGYYGLINNICRDMKPEEFSGILTRGGTILGTKRQPFKMMQVIGDDNVDKVKNMKETYKKQQNTYIREKSIKKLIHEMEETRSKLIGYKIYLEKYKKRRFYHYPLIIISLLF